MSTQGVKSYIFNLEEVMGWVILNLSAACACNYHFLVQTIVLNFEDQESLLTILKCVQIKHTPICVKLNISSLSTLEYLILSRIH